MRTIFIAIAFCAAAWAQDGTCPGWNTGSVPLTQDYAIDSTGHITGDHTITSNGVYSCTYTGSGTCTATVSVTPTAPVMTESGAVTLACHADFQNTFAASATSTAPTATGQAAGAVQQCALCACGMTITFNPLSFSSSPLWSHSKSWTQSCPQKTGGTSPPPPQGCCATYLCGAHYFCDSGTCGCVFGSPIIIDTRKEGFLLTSDVAGVNFDMTGSGRKIPISWTRGSSGNAFLALDRNGNGTIDSAKELFGNLTDQPSSEHRNGYIALAVYDRPENGGNGDGIIDSRDAIYSKLLLWIDANHNGISEPDELFTLPQLGVKSIGLSYTDEHYMDQFGNEFHYRGAINEGMDDSPVGQWSYDVFFVPGPSTKNCNPNLKNQMQRSAATYVEDLDRLLR